MPIFDASIRSFLTSKDLYRNDITAFEGSKVDIPTSRFGNECAKAFLKSSCINSIVTSQPNSVMHSGVDPPYTQIVTIKSSFWNLILKHVPPYEPVVWHYQHANIDLIRQAIDLFDWGKAFSNLDVNKQMSLFNENILNIFENFIPLKTVSCKDKDSPWLKKSIKIIKGKKISDILRRNLHASLSK